MRKYKFLTLLFLSSLALSLQAHVPDYVKKEAGKTKATYRAECQPSRANVDQDINNVRARLLAGGDCWWDLNNGRYIVPKVDPSTGQLEVSSIFAGSVWLGGVDPGGNLKLACQDYRSGGANDFWPGPLTEEGLTTDAVCNNWDRHFKVLGTDIRSHLSRFASGNYTAGQIPRGLRRWPAVGNPYFLEEYGFPLPNTPQGLADFNDTNEDGIYDPLDGDYPTIGIRGCPLDQYPDEMIFWIYNDQGGGAAHAVTSGSAIQMEVQVQAFGYVTNDELNDMTFQRYKLINRAVEDIDSCFFAMWVDADLGCYQDDYIGCDSAKSLMYVYNQDPVDGQPGCDCAGTPTYCNDVPLLGVDYFRGPLDTLGNELGMSSFMYYNNPSVGTPEAPTTDPDQPVEFYNYLNGYWRNGTPLTYGGSGFQSGGSIVKYALPDPPSDPNGWSMCTAGLPFGDRRTLQATGPFLLKPGAENELIIGIPWVPVGEYNCPDMEALFRADKLAQGLFDNCFKLLNGPDAPRVDWVELDKELVAVLSNDDPASNNCNELYGSGPVVANNKKIEIDFLAPDSIPDAEKVYKFEGYEIYQLINPDVSPADFDDPAKARIAQIVDVKNGVSTLYNWEETENPTGDDKIYTPVLQIEGQDEGIRHTFSFKDDLFALGNVKTLINHKRYYYAVIAYAYNEFAPFDAVARPVSGQQRPYLRGRRGDTGAGLTIHTVIPRPTVDQKLNAGYGDGVQITRLEGVGNNNNFLALTEETEAAILDGSSDGQLTYEEGQGPIDVQIFNPFEVKNGTYELRITDGDLMNNTLDINTARWELTRLDPAGDKIISDKTIEALNEQIVAEYGFSITVTQYGEPGDADAIDNGAIGATITYDDPTSPWLFGFPDTDAGSQGGYFNYVLTEKLEKWDGLDNDQTLSTLGDGYFIPYPLIASDLTQAQFYMLTPAWTVPSGNFNSIAIGSNLTNRRKSLKKTRNVDIVFTSDKSKWSRCIVVETASDYYTNNNRYPQNPAYVTDGPMPDQVKSMDLRYGLSVGKDADADGNPVIDTSFAERGMGWFPGYAIDVVTGERLNIFFGENSAFSTDVDPGFTGRDMMFNPTDQATTVDVTNTIPFYYDILMGGQHFVYVTDTPYDGCETQYELFQKTGSFKRPAVQTINWAGMIQCAPGFSMNSYADGLVPSDLRVSLRVSDAYAERNNDNLNIDSEEPRYQFTIDGREAEALAASAYDAVLDSIKMVPNPYYGYSQYETTKFSNVVKITNLPAVCTVTIYSLDGKFIRQYNRDEQYDSYSQISPALEWDMKNSKQIPVASGVYLVHVDAPGIGKRTLKWFGINRKFDPSGL